MTPRRRSLMPEAWSLPGYQRSIYLTILPLRLLTLSTDISKRNKHVKEENVRVLHTLHASRTTHSRALLFARILTFVNSHNRWRNCAFDGVAIIIISSYLRPRIHVSISGKHEMRCVRSTNFDHVPICLFYVLMSFMLHRHTHWRIRELEVLKLHQHTYNDSSLLSSKQSIGQPSWWQNKSAVQFYAYTYSVLLSTDRKSTFSLNLLVG